MSSNHDHKVVFGGTAHNHKQMKNEIDEYNCIFVVADLPTMSGNWDLKDMVKAGNDTVAASDSSKVTIY